VFSGAKLEQLRLAKQLTQHDLASRLRTRGFGTTQATISRWESQGHQPSGAVLPALAEELECSIGDFYGSDDDEEEDPPLTAAEMDLYMALRERVRRQMRRTSDGARA
jgi:transcriptional regulator with XRE-family HTH domain